MLHTKYVFIVNYIIVIKTGLPTSFLVGMATIHVASTSTASDSNQLLLNEK